MSTAEKSSPIIRTRIIIRLPTEVIIKPSTKVVIRSPTKIVAKPTTGVVIRPPTGTIIRPSTGAIIKLSTGTIIRPSTGAIIKPSTGTIIRPPTGTIIRPPTGTIIKPSTGTIIKPSTGTIIRPPTGTIIRPPTGTIIRPPTGAIIRPPTGAIIRPPTGAIIRPPTGAVIRPPTGAIIKPSTGAIIKPPTGAIIKPSTGAIIKPPTGAIIKPPIKTVVGSVPESIKSKPTQISPKVLSKVLIQPVITEVKEEEKDSLEFRLNLLEQLRNGTIKFSDKKLIIQDNLFILDDQPCDFIKIITGSNKGDSIEFITKGGSGFIFKYCIDQQCETNYVIKLVPYNTNPNLPFTKLAIDDPTRPENVDVYMLQLLSKLVYAGYTPHISLIALAFRCNKYDQSTDYILGMIINSENYEAYLGYVNNGIITYIDDIEGEKYMDLANNLTSFKIESVNLKTAMEKIETWNDEKEQILKRVMDLKKKINVIKKRQRNTWRKWQWKIKLVTPQLEWKIIRK